MESKDCMFCVLVKLFAFDLLYGMFSNIYLFDDFLKSKLFLSMSCSGAPGGLFRELKLLTWLLTLLIWLYAGFRRATDWLANARYNSSCT